MGWVSGDFEGRLTARAVVRFVFGEECDELVLDAVRDRDVVYAAVRTPDHKEVWGLVLVIKRDGHRLHVKSISDDMGPYDDRCPARVLDLLTEPSNDWARNWRSRCRTRLASTSGATPILS